MNLPAYFWRFQTKEHIPRVKTAIFYFRNLDPTQNLHRYILPLLTFIVPLLTFIVDLTFGKILNIWDEKSVIVGELPI